MRVGVRIEFRLVRTMLPGMDRSRHTMVGGTGYGEAAATAFPHFGSSGSDYSGGTINGIGANWYGAGANDTVSISARSGPAFPTSTQAGNAFAGFDVGAWHRRPH